MDKSGIIVIAVILVLMIAGVIVFFVLRNRGTGGGGTGGGTGGGVCASCVVRIENDQFIPRTLVISKGETVQWQLINDGPHSVVSTSTPTKAWADSGTLSLTGTKSFEHQFDTAGEFPYKCGFHPGIMTGIIEVEN